MRENVNTSVYHQSQTIEELQGKLYSVEAVLNSRPILISDKDSGTRVLTPKQLLSPFLSANELSQWAMDVLGPVFQLDSTASLIAKNTHGVLSGLQEALLAYLQQDGIRYRIVMGEDSKPDTKGLLPQVDDIVLYKSDKSRKFGIITALHDKNICSVRTVHYNQVTVLEKHARLLQLLFRATEWTNSGIPVSLFDN